MNIFMLIIIVVVIFIALLGIILAVRNYRVYCFRCEIIGMRHYCSDPYKSRRIYLKYSYEDMLYSFKPLKLESWFTEEEIKILKGNENLR
jgi:hypothetical protein